MWALGTTPWDEAARLRVEAHLVSQARELLQHGISVVLDFGLWSREERDELRTAARVLGVGVELRYLHAPPDELWRRIEARNRELPWSAFPIRRQDLDEWARGFEPPTRTSSPSSTHPSVGRRPSSGEGHRRPAGGG